MFGENRSGISDWRNQGALLRENFGLNGRSEDLTEFAELGLAKIVGLPTSVLEWMDKKLHAPDDGLSPLDRALINAKAREAEEARETAEAIPATTGAWQDRSW